MSPSTLVVGLGALAFAQTSSSASQPEVLRLETVVREAIRHDAEMASAEAGTETAAAGEAVARAWSEPVFSYQAWAQPLAHPFDPTETNMHMLGLRQSLPFPGQLSRAGEAARLGADARRADLGGVRLKVEALAEHALVAYWVESRELEIHLGHMELAQRTLDAIRARYSSGTVHESDLLRAQTALHRMHTDVAGIQANLEGTRALLNTVMGRPPEAPLPLPDAPERTLPEGQAVRPEVAAAQLRTEQAGKQAELVSRATWAPELMVGFDFMLMPHMPDAYSVMLQVDLPWGSPRRRAAAEQASRAHTEARLAEVTTQSVAGYEVADARARAKAAQAELAVLEQDLIPLAEHTLDATRADYLSGASDLTTLLEAQSGLLDTRLLVVRDRAALGGAIADLRRALALDLLPEGER